MATSHFFNGKTINLPGVYSATKSVSPIAFANASYSKVLIINGTALNAWGKGVIYTSEGEEIEGGKNSLYKFHSLSEARSFFKSGQLWKLSEFLFNPSKLEGRNGISELQYINAMKTTPASMTLAGTSGEEELVIYTKDQTINANGVKKSDSDTTPKTGLRMGYALSLEKAERGGATDFVIKIWQGTFKGFYMGLPYDGVSVEDAVPELVLQSPSISNIDEFIAWAKTNEIFNAGFELSEDSNGSTTFTTAQVTANAFILATGGATTASTDAQTLALDVMKDGDYSVIMSPGVTPVSGLQHYVQSETRFPKYYVVASDNIFDAALEEAETYDSERVWCIYGGAIKKNYPWSVNPITYDGDYVAALVVGRICGLAPQIPGTFKELDIDGLDVELTDYQLEQALDAGLMTINYDVDLGRYVITRAINTLQNNKSLQNPDGSTFSIQISRICLQINTEIVTNAKVQIFGSNETANIFTVSPSYLTNWLKSYLSTKVATEQQDNLIVGFSDIKVERQGDAYYVTYKFETNTEVAFVFFTGFAIN